MANIPESEKSNLKDKPGKPQSLRVLMVEDSEDDVLLTILVLKKGGYDPVYERVETAATMKKALLEKQWDIILCDYKMPQFNAPSAIGLLKESNIDIPIIIVSGTIGEETAVECMRLGAHDYIMKGNLLRLCPAINRELQEADSRRKRRQTEEELQREQIMLARTEGIAHVGSWEWDIASDTVTWSKELFRIFQREPREGAPSFADHPSFYHPDDMARLRQVVEGAIADGTPYELELRAIRKDGVTRICVARGFAEIAPGRQPICLFGSLQDITERKQMEISLRESEERYRNLFNSTPSGLFNLDLKGRVWHVNTAFLQMFGYPDQESAKGADFFSLCHDDADAQRLQNLLETRGSVTRIEMCLIHLSKKIIWCRMTIWRSVDYSGKTVGYDGLIDDVSEYKMISKLLNDTNTNFDDLE
ncbi:MAG: PAS domain S-box protein [Deltaproteobacteria bacterium]